MAFAASQMNHGHNTSRGKACEELILQRRKTNSPTIEDDFTVDLDDDEPFDEPKSPQKEKMNIAKGDKIDDNVDAEIDTLCWTGSDLDDDDGKKESISAIGDSKERTVISHVSSSSNSYKLKNNQIINQKDATMDKSKRFQSKFDNTTNISNNNEQIDRIDEGENESDGFRSKLETNEFEQRDEVEDDKSSRSIHSLVWSGSDLDDVKSDNIDDQNEDHVDQRDDNIFKTQDNEEQREESADNMFGKHSNQSSTRIDDSMQAILMTDDGGLQREERRQCNSSTKGHSEENLQDDLSHVKNDNNYVREERPQPSEAHAVAITDHDTDKNNPHEDFGIRVERSTDDSLMEGIEPDNYGCDELSAFSLAASVTASVTKRTRNTKTRSKFPKSPCYSTVFTDAGISIGHQSTVATADIEAGMATGVDAVTCSLLRPKKVKENGSSADAKKNSNAGDEDLLDRFFENIESRVCPTPKQGERIAERDRNNEDGYKRLINPFIDHLEKFDSVFEQIESVACPDEDENVDAITIRTPVAFAAAKFTELLDKIESYDTDFVKSKENAFKSDCNFEFNEDDFKELDEDMPSENTPYEALEKAIQNAEKMVKEQKRSSFDKKDQLQKLKEQWFAARLNWKLKQTILAEIVKRKTAEAAKTTTKCVDTMVSSCHQPSMSSVAESNSETKNKKDDNTKKRTKQNKASVLTNSNGHESEVNMYDDASSIDQSGFFSVMTPSERSKINSKPNDFRSGILSPSEHSNIYSGRQNIRSVTHGAASEDEMSASFLSFADNAVRSPHNLLSPSSRNCPSEHSNINSSRRNFRLNMHDAASEDEMSASFLSFTDNVVRSPHTLSPSSRNGESVGTILSDGPSDEEGEDDDGTNVGVTIGVSTGPLAVIAEEAPSAESMTSDDTSNRKEPKKIKPKQKTALRRWAYPGPSYYNEKGCHETSLEWFDKLKGTVESVYTVSERILDRAQCASATINFAESNSFEDDHEESHHQVHNRPDRGDSTRSSSTRPMTRQNSIVDDDNYSVSIMAEPEKKVCKENYYESSVCDDDDLSGFESALNTMDSIQDERPPMLRLLKERNDSRSYGSSCEGSESNKSKSKVGSVHSRLSSEIPDGYSLADSIRHASLSTRNNQANRSRVSQEPRGNKLKNDSSTHVRKSHLPPHLFPPPPPTPNTKKEDCDFTANTKHRIRSPRSSETNDTSDMTAVSASSSDVAVTKLVDSTHSKRSMVIRVETPKAKELMKIDNRATSISIGTISQEHSADDDGDKGTVFSYNTSSTGSTEFKDCYQDAIPSLSTMGTVPEVEEAQSPAEITEQNLQKANVPETNPGTAFLPSDENIVKSMALLSVSATVFNKSENDCNYQAESVMHEIESVPSASYHKSEILEDTIVEESLDSEPLLVESLKNEELKEPLAMPEEDEDTIENDEKLIQNPLIDLDGNKFDGQPGKPDDHLELESKQGDIFTEESREDIVEDPAMETYSKKFRSKSVKESDLPQQLSTLSGVDNPTEEYYLEKSFENDTAVDRIMEEETFDSDELILESLKHQESLKKHMEEQLSMVKAIGNSSSKQKAVAGEQIMIEAPIVEGIGEDSITVEPPKLQMSLEDDVAKLTSSKTKVSLSVEDRRKRRLRQRRKFEAVLRGEDDSSSMSTSTMQDGRNVNVTGLECNDESQLIGRVPLISASFDTGFQ